MFQAGISITEQDIRETSSTKNALTLGQMGYTQDGRGFRYSKAGATDLSPGNLTVEADAVTNHTNQALGAAAAAGDLEVTFSPGATAATADQYEDGYLNVQDNAGEGILYLVSGNDAADASVDFTVRLFEPIEVALTTSSEASLRVNHNADVVISATDQGDAPVGVPNVTIPDTEYGWIQCVGPCSVWADEAFSRGADLTIGTGVAGQVEAADLIGEPRVGTAMEAGVAGENTLVHLQIV